MNNQDVIDFSKLPKDNDKAIDMIMSMKPQEPQKCIPKEVVKPIPAKIVPETKP